MDEEKILFKGGELNLKKSSVVSIEGKRQGSFDASARSGCVDLNRSKATASRGESRPNTAKTSEKASFKVENASQLSIVDRQNEMKVQNKVTVSSRREPEFTIYPTNRVGMKERVVAKKYILREDEWNVEIERIRKKRRVERVKRPREAFKTSYKPKKKKNFMERLEEFSKGLKKESLEQSNVYTQISETVETKEISYKPTEDSFSLNDESVLSNNDEMEGELFASHLKNISRNFKNRTKEDWQFSSRSGIRPVNEVTYTSYLSKLNAMEM